ncbi:uncharacterized protein LOC121415460 [Lytechinus variegatus]|uniref:uncharacterized protein LOC121415460 n=1 Tax=Lytechinus variegatus TaxID=7654 RepID=UPI001BB21FED|nr:uncharacterized protein LOC121415460 [Lytechinus variegatus]
MDAQRASVRLLRRWRSTQPPDEDTRKDLYERLIHVMKVDPSDKIFRQHISDVIQGTDQDLYVCLGEGIDNVTGNINSGVKKPFNGDDEASIDWISQLNSEHSALTAVSASNNEHNRERYKRVSSMNSNQDIKQGMQEGSVEEAPSPSLSAHQEGDDITPGSGAFVNNHAEGKENGLNPLSKIMPMKESIKSSKTVSSASEKGPSNKRPSREQIYIEVSPCMPCSESSELFSEDSNRKLKQDMEGGAAPLSPCQEIVSVTVDSGSFVMNPIDERENEVISSMKDFEMRESVTISEAISSESNKGPGKKRPSREQIYIEVSPCMPCSESSELFSEDSNRKLKQDMEGGAASLSPSPCQEIVSVTVDSGSFVMNPIDERENEVISSMKDFEMRESVTISEAISSESNKGPGKKRPSREQIYIEVSPCMPCSESSELFSEDSNRKLKQDMEGGAAPLSPCQEIVSVTVDSGSFVMNPIDERENEVISSMKDFEMRESVTISEAISSESNKGPGKKRPSREQIYIEVSPCMPCSESSELFSEDSDRKLKQDMEGGAASLSPSPCRESVSVTVDSGSFVMNTAGGRENELIPSMKHFEMRDSVTSSEAISSESNTGPGKKRPSRESLFSNQCQDVRNLWSDSETSVKNSTSGNELESNPLTAEQKVKKSFSENGIDFVLDTYKPLSDDEVFNVAEDIESDAQIEALGAALMFSRADINRYLATNQVLGRKTSQGSRTMLFDWRQTMRLRDQRPSFKGALVRAGLVMIADQYFPDVQGMTETSSKENFDEHGSTLRNLARAIENDAQLHALGRELGFRKVELDRFSASNMTEGTVTCKGNTDMLYEWRQRVIPSEIPTRLKKALRQSGLVFLAEKYFPDILQPEEPSLDTLSAKTTAIAYLRKHMVDYYTMVTCQIQRKPWDPEDFADLKNLFTNIIVYFVNKMTGGAMKEFLPGCINDVFRVKVNGRLPNRILLIAAAGMGKTCAVAKMAYDWAYQEENSPLNDIPLFFALKLRAADEDMSLGEAILSETLGNIHGVTPESLEDFIGRHEEDCAMALDGYDEYKGKLSLRNPKSSITQAIGNRIYRSCRIIVTSRPYLENEFAIPGLARIYTKMEINGFTQSQVQSFIKKYFMLKSKPEEFRRLTGFLLENAFSQTIMNTPLFCMMICHLWEEGLLTQISSLTGLFDTIIQFLLTHSKAKDDTFECDIQGLLQGLGKLAMSGLLKEAQKVVFEGADLEGIEESEGIGITLGLLSKQTNPARNITNGKTSRTYVEFFHKMAQEYCGSKFLASSEDDLDSFLKVVCKSRTPLMYANILRFLAGSGDDDILISSIQHILQLEERVMSKEIKHRLLLDCICEARGDISNSTSNFPTLFDNGKICLQSLSPSAVIGLTRLPPTVRRQITSADLMYCNLPSNLTRIILHGLQSCDNLEEMKVWECSLKNPPILQLPAVRRILIGHLDDSQEYSSLIAAVPNVQTLSLESCPNFDTLQHVLQSFMKGLKKCNRQLRSLLVSGCRGELSSLCAKELIDCLMLEAPLLEKLVLFNVNFDWKDLRISITRMRRMTSLREIGIEYCRTTEDGYFEKSLRDIASADGEIKVTLRHAYQRSKIYRIHPLP